MNVKTIEDFDISKLDSNFANLGSDISAIDIKLSEIEQLILDLKNTVNRTQVAIRTAKAGDKTALYRVVNSTMEILSSYYQNYQRFLEIKYRYRKEQDDLTFKTAHFIQIELKKIESGADASHYDVIEVLKKLASMDSSNEKNKQLPTEIQTELDVLENDDDYSLN